MKIIALYSQWKKLSDDQGSVHFMCAWYSLTSEKIEPLPQAVRQSVSYHKPIPAAVLSVYVDRAKDLTVRHYNIEQNRVLNKTYKKNLQINNQINIHLYRRF